MSGYYNRNNRGITKKLGPVTAYADAVLAGYTGTREQWAQDMAKLGQNVTQVAQNTKLTTELAEQTRVNTEQVAKDTADVRELAEETSDNAAQVASNTAESNRLAEETKQAAAQAKEDAEYAGAAADNFRVDTTLSEAGKAAEAKTTGEKFAQLSEEIVDITDVITPDFGNTTANIPITFNGYTRLAETGYPVPIPENIQFNATDYIGISPLTKYKVRASSRWENSYYAIYDENKKLIHKETEPGDDISIKTFTITTPINAKYIIISWIGGIERSTLEVYTPPKKWEGVKWVCFGDSLTEKNYRADKSYYDYVAEETGISILNYGKSGTGYFKTDGENQNFLTRIEELQDVDFDIITFFGSFNDLSGGWTGGSTESTDITQNNVFGFINATLDRLYEIKPFVKVGIITPTPWSNSHGLVECGQYCDGLIEIAKRRGIPILDLFRCSNLHPDKENFRVEFYNENGVQDNGTHPNSKGHERIYPQFREFLKTML